MENKLIYKNISATLLSCTPLVQAELGARLSHDTWDKLEFVEGDKMPPHITTLMLDMPIEAEAIKEWIKENIATLIPYIKPNIKWIKKIALLHHHSSILEHVNVSLYLQFPRNVLQEISRHRVGVSPTVKSTRYTLLKMIDIYRNLKDEYNKIRKNNKGVYDPNQYDTIKHASEKLYEYIDNNLCIGNNSCLLYTIGKYIEESLGVFDNNNISLTPDNIKNILPEAWKTEGVYTCNLRALHHLFSLRFKSSAFKPFRILVSKIWEVLPDEIRSIFFEEFREDIESITSMSELEISSQSDKKDSPNSDFLDEENVLSEEAEGYLEECRSLSCVKSTNLIEKAEVMNAAFCIKCKSLIFSESRHDFSECDCKSIYIDGGVDSGYSRAGGNTDYFWVWSDKEEVFKNVASKDSTVFTFQEVCNITQAR